MLDDSVEEGYHVALIQILESKSLKKREERSCDSPINVISVLCSSGKPLSLLAEPITLEQSLCQGALMVPPEG